MTSWNEAMKRFNFVEAFKPNPQLFFNRSLIEMCNLFLYVLENCMR